MREQEDWQPIETAPKDGSELLIFIPTDADGPYEIALTRWMKDDGVWRDEVSGWTLEAGAPTHWMPLPLPPREGT